MKSPISMLRHLRPAEAPVAEVTHTETEKDTKETGSVHADQNASDVDSDAISVNAQPGVQKMEATTKTWKTSHLIIAYAL
jgi:hypothetical protein